MKMNLKKLCDILKTNPALIDAVWVDEKKIVYQNQDYFFDDESFSNALLAMKREICSRPNRNKRIEWWEYINIFGEFSSSMFFKILEDRKNLNARAQEKSDERGLGQLVERAGIPAYMGELLVSELRVSDNECDAPLKNSAINLGLI